MRRAREAAFALVPGGRPRHLPATPPPRGTPMAVLKLDRWNIAIGEGQPLVVIAGLNVLETEDLALLMARELKAITADLGLPFIFKASYDKANRSSIASYRGPGAEAGLAILAKVKAEVGVPIATDIHE